mmetsp:Transcript_17777/g.30241  ORF Transcript_17777/g.30241 Transcript_17777/m.30241 type:complete len:390 (-) Transcript_17777:1460-2629(-)
MRVAHGSFHAGSDASQGHGREVFIEEILEYEWPYNSKGGQIAWKPKPPNVSSGPVWRDSRTGERREMDDVALPDGWEWKGNWKISHTDRTDENGWKMPGKPDKPRKRSWIRTREQKHAQTSKHPFFFSAPNTAEKVDPLRALGSDPKFDSVQKVVVSELQILSMAHTKLEEMDKKIGTVSDSELLRKSILAHMSDCDSLVKKLEEILQTLERSGRVAVDKGTHRSVVVKATSNKLNKDFNRLKSDLDKLMRSVKDRNHTIRIPQTGVNVTETKKVMDNETAAARTATGLYMTRSEKKEQIARQMMLQGSLDVNADLIRERETEIKHINQELHQVKDMMVNIAELTDQQGEAVSQIEVNTEAAHEKTQKGLEDIQKAEALQKDKGGCIVS